MMFQSIIKNPRKSLKNRCNNKQGLYGTFNYFKLFYPWQYFWGQVRMNWLINIFDNIKWKIEDAIWAIQDKIQLHRELKCIDEEWDNVEEVEIKPKKKKARKKSAKKTKKSI